MNERRQEYRSFLANSMSKEEEQADAILAQVTHLLKQKLDTDDWFVLTNMQKQLSVKRAKLPKKVLRSMEIKVNFLTECYQR